jgi:hypothetical protein
MDHLAAQASSQLGTWLSILLMPWPWPPETPICLVRMPLTDGHMTITAETSGSLKLTLDGSSQNNFVSCPIMAPGPFAAANVGVSWNLPSVNMLVGTTFVISTEQPSIVPAECKITGRVPNDLKDFSKENSQALTKRKARVAGIQRKPKHRRSTNQEMFRSLRDERDQIVDILKLMEEGKLAHLKGLSTRLRVLLADDPMALLQTCAAMVEAPLIVYVPPITRSDSRKITEPSMVTIALAISSTPNGVAQNPADIDVWLASDAIRMSGRIISQKELLYCVGSYIGAHVNRDIHPTVDTLRSLTAGMDGVEIELLLQYLKAVANVCLVLIAQVLARSEFG